MTFKVLSVMALLLAFSTVTAQETNAASIKIEVDCSKTVRRLEANPTGFCMSFLTDDDNEQRKQPFAAVLKSMHVGSLRYPMGTLAENYLFHDLRKGPPQEGKLEPRVINTKVNPGSWTWAVNPDGSYKPEILDFDEFVRMCRESGTEPVVLVATHGHKFPGAERNEEDVLKNAEEWVRYANVTRKLGIKYWELGNEVDLKQPREVMSQDEYMAIYRKLATRMKAVDPTVRTGLGTSNASAYARQALELFPELVDFVVVHHYMGRIKEYVQYVKYGKPFLEKTAQTLALIDKVAPEARRTTTEILITEFSSFCAGAETVPEERRKNSISNAMITFEMLAEGVAMDDRVRFLHFWVTHSPWGKRTGTDYANAFGPDNTILPQGRALEIMGRFVQDRMVKVNVLAGPVRCWASVSKDGAKIAIWLLNRTQEPKKVALTVAGSPVGQTFSTWRLAGTAPDDTAPTWGAGEAVTFKGGAADITIAPLSIMVIHSGE